MSELFVLCATPYVHFHLFLRNLLIFTSCWAASKASWDYGVLFHHHYLTARAEFRDVLPQSGQGAGGLFDPLMLTTDVAGVGGNAIFQVGDGIFALVAELGGQSAEQLCA